MSTQNRPIHTDDCPATCTDAFGQLNRCALAAGHDGSHESTRPGQRTTTPGIFWQDDAAHAITPAPP